MADFVCCFLAFIYVTVKVFVYLLKKYDYKTIHMATALVCCFLAINYMMVKAFVYLLKNYDYIYNYTYDSFWVSKNNFVFLLSFK